MEPAPLVIVRGQSWDTPSLVRPFYAQNTRMRLRKRRVWYRTIASFPGSPSPRTNYTRVTFDLAERLRESLVHFGT